MLLLIEALAILFSLLVGFLSWYFYLLKKSVPCNVNDGQAFHVVQVVEALRKVCPVGFRKNWLLLESTIGLPRCWKRDFSWNLLNNDRLNLKIYGSNVLIRGPSLETLRMAVNTENWAEWKSGIKSDTYRTELFDDPNLREDDYMQSAKITTNKSILKFYRFSYLSSNNSGWVLLWNVQKMDWSFFLVQPIFRELDCCMLTYIFSCYPTLTERKAVKMLISTVNGIKDAVEINSIHITPLSYPFSDKGEKNSPRRNYNSYSKQHSLWFPERTNARKKKAFSCKMFKLLPHKKGSLTAAGSLWNFVLCTDICQRSAEKSKVYNNSKNTPYVISQNDNENKDAHSVADSLILTNKSSGKNNSSKSFNFQNSNLKSKCTDNLDKSEHSSSFKLQTNERTASVLVGKRFHSVGFLSETVGESSKQLKHHSFSHVDLKSRNFSSTMTKDSTTENLYEAKEDIQKSEEDSIDISEIHSLSDDDDANDDNDWLSDSLDENISHAAALDYEIILPSLNKSTQRLTDIITHGNYGTSELQAEVLAASSVNLLSQSDQSLSSRRWCFHSTFKGITVLSKITALGHFNVLSYASKTEINAETADVWKVVKNPNSMFIFDETVKKVNVLEQITDDHKIIHIYHEIHHLLKKEEIDFCFLHTERQEQSKYYLAIRSIEYENCPLMNAVTRGMLFPSGWVLEPVQNDRSTSVMFIYQLLISDPGSLYIQDLSHSVPLYVFHLKRYVMLQPF